MEFTPELSSRKREYASASRPLTTSDDGNRPVETNKRSEEEFVGMTLIYAAD